MVELMIVVAIIAIPTWSEQGLSTPALITGWGARCRIG